MVGAPWSGRLAVVGIGLEGIASMTPRGRRLVESARLLTGVERHLRMVQACPAEKVTWDGRPESLDALLRGGDGQSAVLLASGDPNLFGIGSTLLERFGTQAVDVEPSVSSFQLALARAGVPAAEAALLSAHGRPLATAAGLAALSRCAVILTGGDQDPAAVARALIEAGVEESARLLIAERLGAAGERVREGRLAEPPPGPYDSLAVVVLEREAAPGPGIGGPEEAYEHDAAMITKSEVRSIVLAALDLADEDVVWDLGAGPGSVAIEAGRLAASGAVYAVEQRLDRAEMLTRNLTRRLSWNVDVVCGEAGAVSARLPAPDAVFVGGGGSQVGRLVRLGVEALRRRRSPVAGRLVVNSATLESTLQSVAACRELDVEWRLSQVQVSRARDLGGRLGWEALNPVHVLAARVERA